MGVVAEFHARPLHLAPPFNVDALRAVDQDVADRLVFEEHFQGSQTKGLVQHFLNQAFAFVAIEERLLGVTQMFHHQADLAAQYVPLEFADLR